jgi:hypothetical protein
MASKQRQLDSLLGFLRLSYHSTGDLPTPKEYAGLRRLVIERAPRVPRKARDKAKAELEQRVTRVLTEVARRMSDDKPGSA